MKIDQLIKEAKNQGYILVNDGATTWELDSFLEAMEGDEEEYTLSYDGNASKFDEEGYQVSVPCFNFKKFQDVNAITAALHRSIVSKNDWKDEVITAFESELEVIISAQPDGTYQVYENHSDAPILFLAVEEVNEDEYRLVASV